MPSYLIRMHSDIDLRTVITVCIGVGFVAGLLGAVPIVWLPNLLCGWILLGGFVATYLCGYKADTVEAGDGLLIGAVFGFFCAIFEEVIYHIVRAFAQIFGISQMGLVFGASGIAKGIFVTFFLFGLSLARDMIFGALGGVIFSALKSASSEKPKQSVKRRGFARI